MTRQELLLAILAASDGRPYTPVQIQKAAFLLATNMPEVVSHGPGYNFSPYDYGPFDVNVYNDSDALKREGLAEVAQAPGVRWNRYSASDAGVTRGRAILDNAPARVKTYIIDVSNWVRGQTFEQLVKSIYDAYPHMKANSIFKG